MMMGDNSIYVIVIVIFLAIMVFNGIRLNKRVSGASDYITGGKSVGVLLGAGMFAATFLSSSSVTGQVGYVYEVGWAGYASILGTVISMFLVGYFLVDKIRGQANYGAETIPDVLEARYDSKIIRGIAALFIVALYMIFVSVELMGIAKTLSGFLNWNYSLSVILATVLTLLYLTMGGILAIAYNDAICALLGIGGTLIVMFLALSYHGGFTNLNLELAKVDSQLIYTIKSAGGWPLIISLAAVWGIGNTSHPAFLGQAFAAKSKKTIMQSLLISSIVVSLFYFATQVLGAAARVQFPGLEDADYAFPMLVRSLLSPLGAAILVASVIALVISTTDTVLLTAGTALGSDFLVKTLGFEADDKNRLTITRISIVIIGLVGMVIALSKPANVIIFQMLNFGAAGAVFFVPIIFGFYWKRATKEGGISAMIGGLISYIVWFIIGSFTGIHPVIIGTLVAILLMVIVSLATPAPSKKVIKQFFSDNKCVE
jgi:Na+/proline symporter